MSIKQSHKESAPSADGTAESFSACWQRERNRECLRVETLSGEVFLLPYQHFIGAHLKQQAGNDILSIAFSSYQLTIEGHRLAEIVSALQEFAVDWISPTPARFQKLRDEVSTTVISIEIEAAE